MASWTRVPAMCDALVAMFTAAAPAVALASLPANQDGTPAQLVIFDGPPVGDVPRYYVAVGYSPAFAGQAFTGSTGRSVEGNYQVSTMGNRQLVESPSVVCEVSGYSGDADPGALSRERARVGAVYSAMLATIVGDSSLAGVFAQPLAGSAYATVSTFRWLQDQPADGATVSIEFTVATVGEAWLPV